MKAPRSRTLPDLLDEQAERYPDDPALICGERQVSYAALRARAGCVAAGLEALGLGPGARIGLLMNNRLEWVETLFAAARLGATLVAFSTWSTRDELDYLLADSAIDALILLDRFGAQHFAADVACLLEGGRHPRLRHVVLLGEGGDPGWRRYDALSGPAADPASDLPPGTGPSAAGDAIIIYTSGSSSRPKSVPLAHFGIVENGFNIGERQGLRPGDRVLLSPPLFWSYGCANALSATLTHGATLVLQGKFDSGEALSLIEAHRCTALYTLPQMTSAMLAHPEFRRERTRSLRTGVTIGAPQDIIAAATELGAAEICNIYGQTETYGNCCVTAHDWPLDRRARSQGRPLPGVEIRIADAETGDMLPAGEAGLIEVRGYVMRGYVGGSVDQNAAAMTPDGFFRTGDMGLLTEAGEMVFQGRTTEMIKKGGINVAPAEVEDVLMRHPAVAQAGVVGMPDPLQGELIAAFIVARPGMHPTAEALVGHCRALASRYKVPDRIEIRDSLPTTPTGKLLRRALKQMAAELGSRD